MGSITPGVLEFETSTASTGALYPMNVRYRPSVDRLSPISDFEEKLVTIWSLAGEAGGSVLFGTTIEPSGKPNGVS